MAIYLPPDMKAFLDLEAKRLKSKGIKGKITASSIVRALITSYYEKRVAGLVTCPDD